MLFKKDAKVYSLDGQEVGSIDRVVIEPRSKEVTHLVVRKGFLLPEDKVIPIKLVSGTVEDGVTLNQRADALELPNFEEVHYVSDDDADDGTVSPYPAGYAPYLIPYPPVGLVGYPGYYGYTVSPDEIAVERNIPKGSIPLQEGSQVISADGEHIGNVEKIFTDSETNQVTHFLISQGLFFKTTKLVPTSWVTNAKEDRIELVLKARALSNLPDYQQ